VKAPSKKLSLFLIGGLLATGVLGELTRRALERAEEFARRPGNIPAGADILFDNHGGYSHAGRRVLLRPDGSYTDTAYTDVVGNERVKTGRYIFTAERTHVILIPQKGVAEDLFRVDHEAVQYWVAAADRERIPKADELRLRQISLRFILDGRLSK
jgi:hypothetical protein